MFFPEFLFQLSARDQQVTWVDPLYAQRAPAAALAAAWSELITTVPEGRALVLTNAVAAGNPGGAQACTFLGIQTRPPTLTPAFSLQAEEFPVTASLTQTINWQGEVIVPPTWQVVLIATFDAAAIANAVSADLIGILIPVGNIARV